MRISDWSSDVCSSDLDVAMSAEQGEAYQKLASSLTQQLKEALRKRDTTLLGVVLNTLLAWPDCCFRAETVRHPRPREVDRKSVVEGKSVSVRVALGGRSIIEKNIKDKTIETKN